MPQPALPGHDLRLSDLPGRRETPVDVVPDSAALSALASAVGVDAVRKLRLSGTLRPQGQRDWTLEAVLGVTVVQPCVATLVPVTTRIDQPVHRRYLSDFDDPAADAPVGAEIEMPADTTVEPLPDTLDLGALIVEELALAIPSYPRASSAPPVTAIFSGPGVAPMRDEDARPFANLRNVLKKD